ncbi:MAG: hydantoinase B/oxoprolinase family protein [Alphaproteobacteria bacterium]|nr:hydantoinase B/oxoprolinase family protein [Alphaproteobacteria bacterium]
MTVDKVTLGILDHYFRAAVEAAGFALKRTAHTTFIKESNDFTTGLVTPGGEHFAYPVAIGAQSYVGIDFSHFIESLAPWNEGDIGVANCPYLTKGVSTHLPDYHLIKPIFARGRLVAFAWAFIHSSDMGGIVAGSILPSAYEIFQEGIRIPPKKLFSAGVVQEDVRSFLLSNVRIPEKNWGDLNAVAAALGTTEQRVHQAVSKWGLQTVEAGRDALIDYAEERARAIISEIPDGEYVYQDYLEDDVVSDMPVRVKIRLTKDGHDGLHLDFTGSDPQVGAAFNIVSAGRHPFLCGALLSYLRTVEPSIPVNGGLIRPIRFTAPEGSVVNATFPAAVGVRYAVTMLVYNTVQGLIAQAHAGATAAAGPGQTTILAISLMDSASGRRHVAVVQPMIGGSGGRRAGDGVDGNDFSQGSLANTPAESIENEIPVLIREYSIVPDSGGPGKFRGGMAVRLDFQVFHPDTIVTARGMGRFRFQPWGLYGGRAGATGDCWVNPGAADQKRTGKIDVIRMEAGDTFSFRTPGGGGYGDPLERNPDAVLADVEDGVLSREGARRDYGVVITDGKVDTLATSTERVQSKEGRPASSGSSETGPGDPDPFDVGPARKSHEEVFSMELSDALAAYLFTLPPGLRYYAKQKMFAGIRQLASGGAKITPAQLAALWTDLQDAMGLCDPPPPSPDV